MLPIRNDEQNLESTDFIESPPKRTHALLAWGSLALAAAESLCVAAVGLSGIRVALGLTSLLAAGAAGPAQGFHRNALRIPFLAAGAIGACLTLLLLWNEERLRKNPAAAWRIRPLTKSQRRRRWFNLTVAIVTLLLVGAEITTHSWFHHEL
jgi:predicted anti-sigma-YlaC factor YlaD